MRRATWITLTIITGVVIALGSFLYSRVYFWRSIEDAVVQKNGGDYPAARIYKSREGVIAIRLDKRMYLYFPETQKIGMPSGPSFFRIGTLLFSSEPKPQVFWADGVKIEKADLYATDNLIEFTDTLDGRVSVSFPIF